MKTVKYHLIDIHGNRISDIEFDNCVLFNEKTGIAYLKRKQYVYGLENSSLFPVPYNDAWYGVFSGGLCKFGREKKKGFISAEGKEVLPAIYDSTYGIGFVDGEAYVGLENKLLRINKTGEILADLGEGWELEYNSLKGRCNCYKRLENNSYCYYIADKNMENMHGPYKEAGNLVEEIRYLKINKNSNEMYVDENFEKIFEKPDWCSYMSTSIDEGRLFIREGKKHKAGFLDQKGEIVIQPVFKDCGFFSENRVSYKKGKLWGIIDEFGNEILPPTYEMIKDYSNGLACVFGKKKYGFINRDGELVIPMIYDEARPFDEGISAVGIKSGAKSEQVTIN